ncbi:hypothetical protein ABZ467_27425 [Streptomyces sp. NPDC005727]|uniref:hypothetical protein n=1 Tax=Streptomyces sp. NPDC005727 TaxID=3157053 RepID=UPI0034017403
MANDPVAWDDSGAADTSGAPVAPRPRRRGRAARLIGAGALLGLVAGVCAGYLVQADREPTKLSSLSQPVIKQAKGEAEPLSAAQDRKVRTDGDLRKLLLAKPRGARDLDWLPRDGWLDLAAYADGYTRPGDKFRSLVTDQFRRAAVTGWKTDASYSVEIRLVQFRQEDSMAASDTSHNLEDWAEKKPATESRAIPGTGDGRAYVHDRAPSYSAEAHAWRGDIAMEIWVYGTTPISGKTITDLAERQMERL